VPFIYLKIDVGLPLGSGSRTISRMEVKCLTSLSSFVNMSDMMYFPGTSETVFQSWLHKITVIEPFFNGLSPFSTIFHGAPYKINSQTNLKFIHGNAAPN
jgi:hypothetical protein